MKKIFLLPFLFVFAFYQNINAQSPYKLSWGKESIILGTGLITAVAGSAIDNRVVPLTQTDLNQLNRNEVNSFDRSATNNYSASVAKTSDYLLYSCIVSPVLFTAGKKTRSNILTIGVMYVETTLFSYFLPSLGKGGVQRIRPFAYNAEAPLDEKLTSEAKRSFFSAHATISFASAVFLSTVYSNYYPGSKWKPYVWGGSLLAAGSIGVMRYVAGAHFPTDILIGAAVGSAIGYLIPRLHKVSNKSDLSILPFVYDNKTGISVVMSF